jgi:hypothetical protein
VFSSSLKSLGYASVTNCMSESVTASWRLVSPPCQADRSQMIEPSAALALSGWLNESEGVENSTEFAVSDWRALESAPLLVSTFAGSGSGFGESQSVVASASLEVLTSTPAKLDVDLLAGAAGGGVALVIAIAITIWLCRRRGHAASANASAAGASEVVSETCDGMPTTSLFMPLAPTGIDGTLSFSTNTTLWNFSNDFDHQTTTQAP